MTYRPDKEICDVVRSDVATDTSEGFELPRLTTTERDALTSVSPGTIIWNTTTTQAEIYNGSTWGAL